MTKNQPVLKITIGFFVLATLGCAANTASTKRNPNSAIVNGRAVLKSDVAGQSVAALIAQTESGQALCTGSIVSEDTILTAAHCVDHDPQQLTVVFGLNLYPDTASETRDVTGFTQNPRWLKSTARGRGDLALVHFKGGLPEGYQPVELAGKNLELSPGTEVTMLGYGVTEGTAHLGSGVLRMTTTTVLEQVSPTELLTDGRESSVCFGDSGGPAFSLIDDHWVQWGVASSVLNKSCDRASVHTSVVSYVRWISAAAKKLREEATNASLQPINYHTEDDINF